MQARADRKIYSTTSNVIVSLSTIVGSPRGETKAKKFCSAVPLLWYSKITCHYVAFVILEHSHSQLEHNCMFRVQLLVPLQERLGKHSDVVSRTT